MGSSSTSPPPSGAAAAPTPVEREAAAGPGPAWLQFGRSVLESIENGEDRSREQVLDDLRARDDLLAPSAFSSLVINAGLPPAHAEVLALLASAESDWTLQRMLGRLQGDANRNRVTLGLLPVLLGGHHAGALAVAPEAPLVRAEFVSVLADGPWADQTIILHPAVVWALVGDVSRDPDLPSIEFIDVPADPAVATDESTLVVVTGDDRMRRRRAGAVACAGDRFVVVTEPTTDAAWSAVVREATITGRGVIVEIGEAVSDLTRRMLERATHLGWVISAARPPTIEELPARQWREVESVSADATEAEWADVLGPDVARDHRLSLDQLHRVSRVISALDGDVDAAVRRLAAGRLEQLARRIRPTRRREDIILSDDRIALLGSIVDRARTGEVVFDEWGYSANPSRGLVALFSGPSGTGKTLAAEIIAGELGLDLFKLDLSAVVSKYIGETEKHLDQLFDAAGAGNSVLFFDEADSLFGKRSEVKDARDRYANIEVSYLLQRLEAYDGVVIMATNFEKNVDEAFLRRIHVRIEFAIPAAAQRSEIWRHSFPERAPLADDVDLHELGAQFELSGGAIRNAALSAGFVAAAAGTSITLECVITGIAREYRKMGRLITPKDFGVFHDLVDPISHPIS